MSMKNFTKLLKETSLLRPLHLSWLVMLLTVVFGINTTSAQIALRSSQTNTNSSSSVTITKPANLAVGDLMLANIVQSDNDNRTLSNATATGWTIVAGEAFGDSGNNSWWGTVLYKVATNDDVAAANFTFAGNSQSDDVEGGIAAFSGVAVTGGVSGSPFDVAPGSINNLNSDDLSAPSITTTTAGAAIIMIGMVGDNRNIDSWRATSPATLNEIFDVPYNADLDMGMGMAWALKTPAGATGNGAGELSGNENDYNGAMFLALRPCTNPTVTPVASISPVCFSASPQTTTMPYSASTNSPISYSIDWNNTANSAGLIDQDSTAHTFVGAGGVMPNVAIQANVAAGTYNGTLTIISAGGCRNTVAVSVTISATPTVSAGATFTKSCIANVSGANIGENNDATSTYLWSPATGLSSATVSNPFANPTTTTTYTVVKTKTASGCTATANVTVTVNITAPTVSAGTAFTKTCIANASGATIGETNDATATYLWSPATGLSSATVSNPLANPSITTTYTVTKTTTANGCTATDQVTVTVGDTTPPTVSAGTAFSKTCVANISGANIGEADDVSATYSWSPSTGLSASNVSNPLANPSTTMTYTVTKTSIANGCFATANVTVTVDNTLSVAAGSDFTKTCTNNPSGKVIGEANVSGNTYSWSPATGISNVNISNPTANPTETTTYTVTKTNTTSGCEATSQITVTVDIAEPAVSSVTAFTKTCVENTTGANIGETNDGSTYSWSPVTGLSSSTASNPSANPTTTTMYTVTKTKTSSGCTSTAQVTVTVDTTVPTVAALTGDQTVCIGSTTVFSSTTEGGSWGTSNGAIASVSDGTVTGIAAGEANINYTVIGTNGCETTVTRTVTVNPVPSNATVSGESNICAGSSTNLTGSAVIAQQVITTINEDDFNGTPTYTSDSGFSQKANDATVGNVSMTNNIDSSSFMATAISAPSWGSVSITSNLTSPVIDATIYGAPMTFTYNHAYSRGNTGTREAVIEVSTNGTTWTQVDAHTSNKGGDNDFVPESIDLSAYANSATLQIRFVTTITVSFWQSGYWVIDNPILKGSTALVPLYSWTADTASGINGLPAGASTPATGNAVISVAPSATTNYTLVAHDPFTGCTASSGTHQITVNPLILPTFSPVAAICSGDALSALPTISNNSINGTWSPALDNTLTTTYTFTPNLGECGTATTMSIIVNANITYYADTDGDGYGAGAAILSCTGKPENTSINNTDCDPNDALIWRMGNLFIDADGDSYNNGFPAAPVCYGALTPAGYVAVNNGTDCDDALSFVNSNASEILGNGIDDNCDGTVDEVTPTSYLAPVSCGATLTNLASPIYAYQLASFPEVGTVQVYRFRVTNGGNVRTFDSPTSSFNLTNLAGGAVYGTTYTVAVSIKTGGYFRAYGTDCTVSTPAIPNATNIANPACGSTLVSISATIYCNAAPGASGYRFRVSDGGSVIGTVDTSVNRFSLTSIAGIQFGTTYQIDVLLAYGGQLRQESEYGPACSISTPATPGTSRVTSPSCGSSISSFYTTIYAQQVIGAQGYKFVVTNGAQTREYTTPNSRFNLRNLQGGAAPSTTYTIRVDVLYNASYVQGLVTCDITTTAGATRSTANALDIYEVKAYPNPYADTFKLDVNTSSEGQVGVRVYDMLGREVESREASVDNITNLEIGSQYPSGVYNIIVTQGDNVKTLRVIKR